jgi:hypothetical protein
MGVALSMFVEYARFPNQPQKFGLFAKTKPTKIYELWCLLGIGDGGICSAPIFTPRGVPEDLSSEILNDYAELLDETLSELNSNLPKYIQKRLQFIQRYPNQIWVSSPDNYDSSWLTASELETVCNQFELEEGQNPYLFEYRSLVALLQTLNQGIDENSRVVFWFW